MLSCYIIVGKIVKLDSYQNLQTLFQSVGQFVQLVDRNLPIGFL